MRKEVVRLENAKNSDFTIKGGGRWEMGGWNHFQRKSARLSAHIRGKKKPSRILGRWQNDILAYLRDKNHLYNCGWVPFRARVAGGQSLVFGEDGDGRWEMGDGILGNLKFEN